MSAKYVAGPDIDLDDEVVYDKQGQRITEARARQIARDTLGIALQEAAQREHASTSDLIRKALERYLAS